jgi:hypothetical protein
MGSEGHLAGNCKVLLAHAYMDEVPSTAWHCSGSDQRSAALAAQQKSFTHQQTCTQSTDMAVAAISSKNRSQFVPIKACECCQLQGLYTYVQCPTPVGHHEHCGMNSTTNGGNKALLLGQQFSMNVAKLIAL